MHVEIVVKESFTELFWDGFTQYLVELLLVLRVLWITEGIANKSMRQFPYLLVLICDFQTWLTGSNHEPTMNQVKLLKSKRENRMHTH